MQEVPFQLAALLPASFDLLVEKTTVSAQRPDVEKRHLVHQAILDVASRNSLNSIPFGLHRHRVRQDSVRVRCRHGPVDDHLIESDREDHTGHAKHTLGDHVPFHAWFSLGKLRSRRPLRNRSPMQLDSQFAGWCPSLRNQARDTVMNCCAREGLCDSAVAKEVLKKTPRNGPISRLTVCDLHAFAFAAFSPLLLLALSMRQWLVLLVAPPRVCAHRRLLESVPIADAVVSQLFCFRICRHVADGSVHVSPHTFSRRLHMHVSHSPVA